MPSTRQGAADDHVDTVVVWVAALERGLRTHDFELIRKANEQLDRLGVHLCIAGKAYGRSLRAGGHSHGQTAGGEPLQ